MAYIELSSFDERFLLRGLLGTGSGNVEVKEVRIKSSDASGSPSLSPRRAVKLLGAISSKSSRTWTRCEEECRRLERLNINNYANIVHLHNYGLIIEHYDKGDIIEPFIEMDYIEGKHLWELVSKVHFIEFPKVAELAHDISNALALCHHDIIYLAIEDGDLDDCQDPDTLDDETLDRLTKKYRVIHNDIHPGNIILHTRFTGDPTGEFVLIDFGLSVENDDGNLTQSRIDNCPWEFRAPEKWAANDRITPATDIYSFGCVLYFCMAGEPPFPFSGYGPGDLAAQVELMNHHLKTTPPAIFPRRQQAYKQTHPDSAGMSEPDYPAWFEEMIMKCLEKKPEDRFRDGRELYNFLLSHLHTAAPAQAPAAPSAASQPEKPAKKPTDNEQKVDDKPKPEQANITIKGISLKFFDASGKELPGTPTADSLDEVRLVLDYNNSGAADSRELSCRVKRTDGTTVMGSPRCSRIGFTAHRRLTFNSGEGQVTLSTRFGSRLSAGRHRFEVFLGDKELRHLDFDIAPAPANPAPGTPDAFSISAVKLCNASIDYKPITDFGDPMHDADMRFLCVRFHHEGLSEPTSKRLKFKIIRSDGTMLRLSGAKFTHEVDVKLHPGRDQSVLVYGNRACSVFRPGYYRMEIYNEADKMLHAMMFTILESESK